MNRVWINKIFPISSNLYLNILLECTRTKVLKGGGAGRTEIYVHGAEELEREVVN